MDEMERARKLVKTEEQLKHAISQVNACSRELLSLGKDVKISGWNWDKPGSTASISTQSGLVGYVVDAASRS